MTANVKPFPASFIGDALGTAVEFRRPGSFPEVTGYNQPSYVANKKKMSNTYITDNTHYLGQNGELAEMPGEARKLASFLVLLIDVTTQAFPVSNFDTRIRCKTDACTGSIRASVTSKDGEIVWHCPKCRHNGVIRKWQGTKWDQTRPGELVG